jgi:multidrug efflux pump subunit AcrA (membrane-fusion protein)
MPLLQQNPNSETRHSDDMEDIITAPPSWLIRWGVTIFFIILVLIIVLSSVIKYPDIVRAEMRIRAADAPKSIASRVSGQLSALLVDDNQMVHQGQALAYLESTGDHLIITKLLEQLYKIQHQFVSSTVLDSQVFTDNNVSNIGELQPAYQAFVENLIRYRASVDGGFSSKKKGFLQVELNNLAMQSKQLTAQRAVQQKDFELAKQEFAMNQLLEKQNAETPAELRAAESKYLSKKAPLIQTDAAIIAANSSYNMKLKEMSELANQRSEERTKFGQALNSLISQAEEWKKKYILTAPQNGKIAFAGPIQQNQLLSSGQDVFYLNPGTGKYFGEITIPQSSLGKVKENQVVLVRLKSYPYGEYGIMKGKISVINDVPVQDSVFLSKVLLNSHNRTDLNKVVRLKQGMRGEVDIITEDATILSRITRNLIRAVNH